MPRAPSSEPCCPDSQTPFHAAVNHMMACCDACRLAFCASLLSTVLANLPRQERAGAHLQFETFMVEALHAADQMPDPGTPSASGRLH